MGSVSERDESVSRRACRRARRFKWAARARYGWTRTRVRVPSDGSSDGVGCLASASPHGEKISLAVVVGGGAVAGGDTVKSEGRRYRAGTYARSLTPSAW